MNSLEDFVSYTSALQNYKGLDLISRVLVPSLSVPLEERILSLNIPNFWKLLNDPLNLKSLKLALPVNINNELKYQMFKLNSTNYLKGTDIFSFIDNFYMINDNYQNLEKLLSSIDHKTKLIISGFEIKNNILILKLENVILSEVPKEIISEKIKPISLKVTTKEILEYIIITRNDYYINESKFRKYKKTQHEKELNLFKHKTAICSIKKLSKLHKQLGNLNLAEYKNLLNNQFYDSRVMLASMCIANSFLYTLSNNILAPNKRIRHWLSEVKKLGSSAEDSLESIVMLANLKNLENVFVLKAPKNPEKSLIHEWVIGALGLNPLRAYVPNFAYIMGAFNCSKPIDVETDKENEIVMCMDTPSLTNGDVSYIVYEKIEGISMITYVSECSFEEFLDKYLQILYALSLANEKCNFTHYDLHTDNVIIRNIYPISLVAIPYKTEKVDKEYLITDGIATAIDYGFSHITFEGQEYGYNELPEYGIIADTKFPLHDAYKLLCFSMYYMSVNGNMECYNKCKIALRYFIDEDNIDDFIKEQKSNIYALPYLQRLKDITIFDFTSYLRMNIPEINNILKTEEDIMRRDIKILEPTGSDFYFYTIESSDKVQELTPVYNKLGLNQEYKIDDIFDFYDITSQLQQKILSKDFASSKQLLSSLINNFRPIYNEKKLSYIENVNNELAKIRDEIHKITILRAKELNLFPLEEPERLLQYKNNFYSILYIMDRLQRIIDIKIALEYTVNIYQDEEMNVYLNEINDRVQFIINGVEEEGIIGFKRIIEGLYEDINYIKEGIKPVKNRYSLIDMENEMSEWYFRDFLEFSDILISLVQYLNSLKRI